MRRLVVATLMLTPALALASHHEALHMAFSGPPTLAAVQPGIQVAVDSDQEVFYADNFFWVRRGNDWYHASHYNDAFTYVDAQYVSPALAQIPAGYYVHYHPGTGYGHGHGTGHGHHHGGGYEDDYGTVYDSGYSGHGGCGH